MSGEGILKQPENGEGIMKDCKITKHIDINHNNRQDARLPGHSNVCTGRNRRQERQNRNKLLFSLYFIAVTVIMVMAAGCAEKTGDELTELKAEHGDEKAGLPKAAEEAEGKAKPPSQKKTGKKKEAASENEPQTKDNDRKDSPGIFVYVCGAVNAPGVYELDQGSRVYEAIAMAGGLSKEAAGETLNQASVARDGERIYVPSKSDLEKGLAADGRPETTDPDASKEDKVNINTSTKEELMNLPGIGDAKAESIISHREANGPFTSIEDLMQVEGIKQGVFNKIKDRITS